MDDSQEDVIANESADPVTRSRAEPSDGLTATAPPAPPSSAAAPAGARDRDRSRRPARPGRAAATVLVVGLLLLGAAAAEAQTVRILVSNSAQTADDSANTNGNDHAQLFSTGAHAAGYTFTRMFVNSEDPEDDDFDVEICEADTTANEFPTSTCTALTAPTGSNAFAGNVLFTHTGLTLSANTNYVVVVKQRGTGSVELNTTTSGGEDTALGLSDWSIKDKFYWKSGSTWMLKSGSDEALRIIVRGYAVVPVVSPPPVFTIGTGTEIWSATLTVGSRMVGAATFYGWGAIGNYAGAGLTDTDFTFGGDTYDLIQISLDGTSLALEFPSTGVGDLATQATRNKLTLHVGSDTLNFGAGILSSNGRGVTWPGTSLSWSASDLVALRITDDSTPVTIAPAVTSVEFTSTPPTPAYAIGGVVETTVNFSAAVDITGTPQLELDFAGTPIAIDCVAVTNTTWMGCYYEVVAGDSAPNGVAIAADKLTLNDGTITATGSTTITADLDHDAVAIDAAHKVDGIRPTLVTTGDDAPTTSTDGTQVILTFSEDIGEVNLNSFQLEVESISNQQQGATATISGKTVTLTLLSSVITIQHGQSVELELGQGAVEDLAGNLNSNTPKHTVTNGVGSTTAPTVTAVALTSAPGSNNTYAIGDAVEATVTFSAAVDIPAAPQLELDFAGTAKAAACATGTNTTTTACSYTVVVGDVAAGGIAIGANTLTGGTIYATGSTTITADLDHDAVDIDAGHTVDGIRPTLVTTGDDAPRTSTDGTTVILTFSEAIGGVSRDDITIQANGVTLSTTAASRAGNKAELTLATALTATATNLTVSLASNDAVFQGVAVHARRVAGRVAEFVEGGLVIPVRGGELFPFRERHLVGLQVVTGAIAAHVRDVDAALLNDTLGRLVGLPFGLGRAVVARAFQRQPVGLFDVEHGVAADHRRARAIPLGLALGRAGRLVGRARLRLRLLVVKLVKQHVGGLLALAHLPAHVLDLFVGGPAVIAVALRRLGHAQVDRIPAPVRLVGLDVLGESALAGLPRFLPRRHAGRDLLFERAGEFLVIVVLVPARRVRRRLLFAPCHRAAPSLARLVAAPGDPRVVAPVGPGHDRRRVGVLGVTPPAGGQDVARGAHIHARHEALGQFLGGLHLTCREPVGRQEVTDCHRRVPFVGVPRPIARVARARPPVSPTRAHTGGTRAEDSRA